jgi:hypothetical protein
MAAMKKLLSLLALLSLACAGLDAEDAPDGPVPTPTGGGLCGEGMEASHAWQGEYPGPVVHVMQSARLPFRADPCGAIQGECTVPVGLYHPWAEGGLGFVTVRPVVRYRVTKSFTSDDGAAFSEGDILEVVVYFGEGFCGMRLNGEPTDGYCPEMLSEEAFEKLNPEAENIPDVQLFQTRCAEGGEGWIEVGTALAAPGVEEGVITGYGSVGPGTEGGI